MKFLLVSVNSKYIHSTLALWYLKTAAGNTDDIEIFETTIKAEKSKILEEIIAKNPAVVCFSCYIWNISFVKDLVSMVKKSLPTVKILLGGAEVSYNQEAVFAENSAVDYIISGEGEVPFAKFYQAIKNNSSTENIHGLSTREKISPPFVWQDNPINPYTKEYFQRLEGRIVYIETSRGCPYSCTYCLSGRLGGVRFFPLDEVKENLDKLSVSGTKTIKFVDRTFNANEKRAIEIIEYITAKNPQYKGVCYHFEMAGDIMSEAIISALGKAPKGLFQIEVGVQSFNDFTLKAVNRKTDLAKVAKNLQSILSKGNVHVHMDLIAGLPFEDYESFKIGFNKLFLLAPHMLQLGFLKLLHGSQMKNEDIGEFKNTPPYEVISTPWITKTELEKLKDVEDAVDRLYNSGRFKALIYAGLEKFQSPFDLFYDFGTKNKVSHGEGLERYCERVLSYFSQLLGEDLATDLLKEQWIKVNSSGRLPLCIKGENMRGLLSEIDKNPSYPSRKSGVRRSAAKLKLRNEIIYVDYENIDLVTKEYEVKFCRGDLWSSVTKQ